MTKIIIYILTILFNSSFINIYYSEQTHKILFIGHAYGKPEVWNNKMDPSVTNYLNNFSTEKYEYIIWGGDFINDCNSEVEINNFLSSLSDEVYNKSIFIWGNHEYICYGSDKLDFIRKDENRRVNINGYDLFFLNTNFNDKSEIDPLITQVNLSKKKVIFSHQVLFSKTNWLLRVNSRDYYDLANLFYDELLKNDGLTIVTGDVGAIRGTPFLTYYKKNGSNLLSSGIGNGKNNFALEIELNSDNLSFNKINLDDNKLIKLKPEYFFATTYNMIYYFFLSKKRTVFFVGIIALILVTWKRNFFIKKIV